MVGHYSPLCVCVRVVGVAVCVVGVLCGWGCRGGWSGWVELPPELFADLAVRTLHQVRAPTGSALDVESAFE